MTAAEGGSDKVDVDLLPVSQSGRGPAAIVYVDVVGYSTLLGDDDTATVARLQLLNESVIKPLVREHDGRLIGAAGDAFMLVFGELVNAGRFAFALQHRMSEFERDQAQRIPIQLRIGIDAGDVIVKGTELYGNALNIASRLQAHAPPGGVCVSSAIHDVLKRHLDVSFQPLGPLRLKNIARPVETFLSKPGSWDRPALAPADALAQLSRLGQAMPPLSNMAQLRHSIAVMRFSDSGGTSEDGYVADGVVEDVITALSLFRNLFVVGPSTSMRYVSGADDPIRVGRELEVRYVVEGSFRRFGPQIRTSARLLDADTGAQLWSERFDLAEADIFERQDRITRRIVRAIEPTVLASEIERATRKPTERLDAYDFYLQAMQYRGTRLRDALIEHHRLLAHAVRLDPGYAPALAFTALCYAINVDHGHGIPWLNDRAAGLGLAQSSFAAGADDPVALTLAAHAHASLADDFASCLPQIDRAVMLNPNYAEGWIRSGVFRVALDELDAALTHTDRAIALSPRDRYAWMAHVVRATVLLFLGRYEEATEAARASLREPVRHPWAYRILVAALHQNGRGEAARTVAHDFMLQTPEFGLLSWRERNSFTRNPRYDIVESSLRAAGVPD